MSDAFNGIESLDHPVIAVQDLVEGRAVYERLGFTVPPRGSHVEWGTGNLCVMFPDDYLELRGIIDADRFTMHLDAHLERFGEGLMGVAFRTDDVSASYAQLLESSVATSPTRRLTRNFEHPEGWTQPSFELCVPQADTIEGLMHVVVLQHLTPELIREARFLSHPNGSVAIADMSGWTDSPETVARKMQKLLGPNQVEESASGVQLSVPSGQHIQLYTRDAFEALYGALPENRQTPRLEATTLVVSDLAETERCLAGNGVPYQLPRPGLLRVERAFTCGVILDFCESGST